MQRTVMMRPVAFVAWISALACLFKIEMNILAFLNVLRPFGRPSLVSHRKQVTTYRGDSRNLRSWQRCGASDEGAPRTVGELVLARRQGRWAGLREALDWTRYHLQVAVLESGSTGRSRVAAGLFERLAQFHSCAGALPMEAFSMSASAQPLSSDVMQHLRLAGHWADRDVSELDVGSLYLYDVVVCLDAAAREALAVQARAIDRDVLPPHVVDLYDFGSYLELRRPESPIKAWVPDWRAKVDPEYDQRQAEAKAPLDDALAVWHSVPGDLASLIQPRYASVAAALDCGGAGRDGGSYRRDDDDSALLSFHLAGLVRFLMDSYPLDLHGGPGYIPP